MTDALLDLTGRVAVVTGGGAGLGAAVCRELAAAGGTVVAADIAAPVGSGGPATGGAIVHRSLDVTSSRQHDDLVDWVRDAFGRLDIWVNNAGVFPYDETLTMDDESWRRVLAVNLDGCFFGARAAGRAMARQGSGVIVNVGSVSGHRVAADGRAHYAASKAGVTSLTRALARELGPQGVRVLCLAPSAIRTPGALVRNDDPDSGEDDPLAAYARSLPLRRIAEPEEIARVVHFAVSDMASFMTGSTLAVDGGQLAV